jgi:hypothetical protein
MRLSRALQDKLMDTRLRDKLVAEGKVTKQEVEEFLKSLPDETGNFVQLEDDRRREPKH